MRPRIAPVIIAFALALVAPPGAMAHAQEAAPAVSTETQDALQCVTISKDDPSLIPDEVHEAALEPLAAADVANLENALAQAADALQSHVDVSGYGASYQDALEALERVWNDHPDLFFFRTASIWYDYSGRVMSFDLHYYWSASQIAAMRTQYDAAVYDALLWVGYNMTDMEKAKALHDYLVRTCTYDYLNYLHGSIPQESFTAYGALVRGTAVCQGYAEAYGALLREVGIDSTYVSSDAMNHGWNIVTIGGRNYHVDVTWDDPVRRDGTDGGFWDQVDTDHFMISDSAMRARDHYSWSPAPPCTDRTYDNARWDSYSEAVEPLYRFRDVGRTDWYVTGGALEYVFTEGIMTGLNEVTFAPTATLSRAQLATMLWRHFEPEGAASYQQAGARNTTGMADVASGAWYTGAANWAVASGAIEGMAGGTRFAPDAPVSREQVVVILLRLAKRHVEPDTGTEATFLSYSDHATTSAWARASILEGLEMGLIEGSRGTLSPTRACNRAEGATFIMRAIEELDLI